MFIKVYVNKNKCKNNPECIKCINICPVNIFKENDGLIEIESDNEDECTLCNLCLDKCPQNAIKIKKLY